MVAAIVAAVLTALRGGSGRGKRNGGCLSWEEVRLLEECCSNSAGKMIRYGRLRIARVSDPSVGAESQPLISAQRIYQRG